MWMGLALALLTPPFFCRCGRVLSPLTHVVWHCEDRDLSAPSLSLDIEVISRSRNDDTYEDRKTRPPIPVTVGTFATSQ